MGIPLVVRACPDLPASAAVPTAVVSDAYGGTPWLNVLPPLQDADVLIIGELPEAVLRNIADQRPRQLARRENLDTTAASSQTYDVVIVGDGDAFFAGSDVAARWRRTTEAVRREGVVMVAHRAGWDRMWRRRRARACVRAAGFASVKPFLSYPSVDSPLVLVSYAPNPWLACAHLSVYLTGADAAIRPTFRRFLRCVAYRVLGLTNPMVGLLVVGTRHDSATPRTSFEHLERCAATASLRRTAVTIAQRKPTDPKQLLRAYTHDGALAAVGKVAAEPSVRSASLQREYEGLVLLNRRSDEWRQDGVVLPVVPEWRATGSSVSMFSPAVQGEVLADLLEHAFAANRRVEALDLIHRAADLQLRCEQHIRVMDDVGGIDAGWFENYLDLPLAPKHARAVDTALTVQHGDFAAVNLLLDRPSGTWSIVDWEFLAAGYPPLFDVFSFFKSLGFAESPADRDDPERRFIDTFFRENWMSASAKARVARYKYHYGLDVPAFECFLRFLLFLCNRYRHFEINAAGPLAIHERMARYAAAHQRDFALSA